MLYLLHFGNHFCVILPEIAAILGDWVGKTPSNATSLFELILGYLVPPRKRAASMFFLDGRNVPLNLFVVRMSRRGKETEPIEEKDVDVDVDVDLDTLEDEDDFGFNKLIPYPSTFPKTEHRRILNPCPLCTNARPSSQCPSSHGS